MNYFELFAFVSMSTIDVS